MQARWTCGILVLFFLLACGCGATQTYTGAKLPKEQVAYIKGHTYKLHRISQLDIHVVAVDGMKPAGAKLNFEVLPGEHTLVVGVGWSTHLVAAPLVAARGMKLANNTITFRAEAGRSYQLSGEEGAGKLFYVWLEDADTGAFVAGSRPGAATQ